MTGKSNPAEPGSSRLLIPREQWDLLADRILSNLPAADDILGAVRSEEWVKADRLGRHFSYALIFLMDGLGWVADSQEPIEVSISPLVAREVLEQLKAEAEDLDPDIDLRHAAEKNQELIATCDQLLSSLEAQPQEIAQRFEPIAIRDLKDRSFVKQHTLRLLMRVHPSSLGWLEIIQTLSPSPSCGVTEIERALHELLDVDAVVRRDYGFAASGAAALINELWNDLSYVISVDKP